MVISGLIGTTLGLAAGYFGGRVDMAVTFIITVRLAMPLILVALAVVAMVGGSLWIVILVLGLLKWDRFAVVMRAATQQVRSLDYVAAAEATGASTARIIVGEVLPNVLPHLIVVASVEAASAILLEAALSFLGLGVQPPLPSWGLMIAEAKTYMFFSFWLIAIPGTALALLVLPSTWSATASATSPRPAAEAELSPPLLSVAELAVDIATPRGTLHAVRNISFDIASGETLCLVGESGCGKSMTALALMGLLPDAATRTARRAVAFEGEDLAGRARLAGLRGNRMAMIFQEPMTALNPAYTIGDQLSEVHRRHKGSTQAQARARAIELLEKVGITAAAERLGQYPHQLSGGLRQRVMIAMALMCGPALLIADEPTTALDVTIQAQILRLLVELQRDLGIAILLITHDLGVVARVAHRVAVMYAGEIVETGVRERSVRRAAAIPTRAA